MKRIGNLIVGMLVLIAVISTYGNSEEDISSPRQQIEEGKSPAEVICKEGLELIIRSNNKPACVMPQTAKILVDRGLAEFPPIEIVNFACSLPAPSKCIYEIQGKGHISPLANERDITTSGVVTAVGNNSIKGFFLQDSIGDNDNETSDGIFIYTAQGTQVVGVGDEVTVRGDVKEFKGFTEIDVRQGEIIVDSVGTGFVDPVVIGIDAGERRPPVHYTNADSFLDGAVGLSNYDIERDGMDFWESLEGMLVQFNDLVVVDTPVGPYGTLWAVPDNGSWATGYNDQYGIIQISEGDGDHSREDDDDLNPEKIMIDINELTDTADPIAFDSGDQIGSYQGILFYSKDSFLGFDIEGYEFYPIRKETSTGNFTTQHNLTVDTEFNFTPEITNLIDTGDNVITIGNFNVENLDPSDHNDEFNLSPFGSNRIAAHADVITNHLQSPNIIALQEVQDGNGEGDDGFTDASDSFNALINAISEAGGPAYTFYQIDPVNNKDGGAPGGNIRVGYLYDPSQVTLLENNPFTGRLIDNDSNVETDSTAVDAYIGYNGLDANDAFDGSRKPLAATFQHNASGDIFYLINVHFSSRRGSDPIQGLAQPPAVNERKRVNQAAIVKEHVQDVLDTDSDAKIVVLGDFNTFGWSETVNFLAGANPDDSTEVSPANRILTLLEPTNPNDAWSYIFNGNAQTLDQAMISAAVNPDSAIIDKVHVETAIGRFREQISDHDPFVLQFEVDNAPRFELSLSQPTLSLLQGASDESITVTVTPINGFGGTVDFSVTESGPSDNVIGITNPSSVDILLGEGSVDLEIAVDSTATVGDYTLHIEGTDGNLSHSINLLITVTPLGMGSTSCGPNLNSGDVAIVGYNADGADEIAFVVLCDMLAGTEITFTDNGWTASGNFRSREGSFIWSTPTDISAGTVITPAISGMSLSASGDQVLAYQGDIGNPNFIYGFNNEGSSWQIDSSSSNTSALPTGLSNGTTAIALTEVDNAVYVGTTSGTRTTLLTAISNPANWMGDNLARQTMPAGPFTIH